MLSTLFLRVALLVTVRTILCAMATDSQDSAGHHKECSGAQRKACALRMMSPHTLPAQKTDTKMQVQGLRRRNKTTGSATGLFNACAC